MAGAVKQRMIERTAVLLAKKGLQGTSFSEVLEASGAPRGSLYHHFPGGKDELVLAALGFASGRASSVLEQAAGEPATVVAETFIGLWREVLKRSKYRAGCGIVAVTVAADAPALLAQVGNVFRGWRVRLGAMLAEGGVPKERSAATAASLIAACEGAVILARAEQSLEPFELVAGEQIAAVRSAMKAGRRKR